MLVLCAACEDDTDSPNAAPSASTDTATSTPGEEATGTPDQQAEPVLMPNLVGLPEDQAGRRIGSLESKADLGLVSHWTIQPVADCDSRPRTVVAQEPAVGTPLRRRTEIQVRSARLDLKRFRGPCDPVGGELGPVFGADAQLARLFYRFAADPTLGAPFADGAVWNGIEDSLEADVVDEDERQNLSAWQLDGWYAESMGPFSPLDLVAGSGGYYELHDGVVPTCPYGNDETPAELEGLRAITITAPSDTVTACFQWWGVSLFLDGDLIRGVALRMGSP